MNDQTVDIRDFCENLQEECEQVQKNTSDIFAEIKQTRIAKELNKKMDDIRLACQKIVDSISVGRLVIKSAFSGADYQYSHGISLFFPWSYLAFNVSQESYGRLEFVRDSGKNWWDFLELYLDLTMRNPRNKGESKYDNLPITRKTDLATASINHRNNPPNSKWSDGDKLNSSNRQAPPIFKEDPPFYRQNPPIFKQNPPSYKENPPIYRENPPRSKDNPNINRNNPPNSKESPPIYKYNPPGKGLGNIPQYFGRTKNFPLNLTTSGGEG